jgi:hypothetical protein
MVIEKVPKINTVMTKYDCSGSIGARIGSAISPSEVLMFGFKISNVIPIITTNIIPIEPPGGDGGGGLELPDIFGGRSIKGMKVSINYALNYEFNELLIVTMIC